MQNSSLETANNWKYAWELHWQQSQNPANLAAIRDLGRRHEAENSS
jgi:hypothetical protein